MAALAVAAALGLCACGGSGDGDGGGGSALALIGVPAADAGVAPEESEPAVPAGQHQDSGTVTYAQSPPTSGPHRSRWVEVGDRPFYTTEDAPSVEELVHNLEHGYTVLWYDPDLAASEVDLLAALAKELRGQSRYKKFIAAPWDTSRGELPDGKPLVLTQWSTDKGYRQAMAKVSGEAVAAFIDAHPPADSPEPDAP